ncbi:MAG: glycosyltransferase [Bacteroidia bacterium]|nr:glycosyltransferase [Bacteroidia bacterium]
MLELINAFIKTLTFTHTDFYLSIATGSIVLLIWVYHFLIFYRVKPPKIEKEDVPVSYPVSIVVCARNAQTDLETHIPQWLAQDYPEFELIIVDDCSTDESSRFITNIASTDSRIKYILLDPNKIKSEGKKLALTLGIKKAQYEYLLLTDADCSPSSNQWLQRMANGFQDDKSIVLGAAPLQVSSSFWGRLIHFENLLTALHYFGLAKLGFPYMGVGRNLAYTKTAYQSVGGFSQHYHIPAGDDDLFVQSVANATNTGVIIHPESYTLSAGPSNFNAYWRQRLRHLWVGKQYKTSVSLLLSILPFLNLLFLSGISAWLILGSHWLWPATTSLLALIPIWILMYQRGKILQMNKAGALYPFYVVFHSIWYVLVGIRVFFKKQIIW